MYVFRRAGKDRDSQHPPFRGSRWSTCWIAFCLCTVSAHPQLPNRIALTIDATQTVPIQGSVMPMALPQNDVGRVDGDKRLSGITIYFKLTQTQQGELGTLVRAQQTPGSPAYHKWLTPAEYGSRFGLSGNDITTIQTWLEQQGFVVDRISNSRTSITFSGTAHQVESAFQTEIHSYRIGNETHFANATNFTIPNALADVIQSIRNVDDFRPKPFVRFHTSRTGTVNPAFTSAQTGDHYIQPGDVSIIYDIKAAYSAGFTGTGQSIAIVGQSEINLSDIENFQSAAGLTVKEPTLVLVPNSGNPAYSSGDEAESDLDLEYSGGIGKGAAIYLVYVGNSANYSVWDSMQYAVDTDIAPIISMSYGGCEPDLSSSDYSTLEAILEEGASQGQSIIVASGDTGSTACYADLSSNSSPTSEEEELAVNYPASSAYVTALGGTEFPAADIQSSNTTYWDSASGSDVVTSAKSYIPEQVWNDDSASNGAEYALGAGGGGTSIYTARPSWQSGVTGIPSGSYRLVPDISLDSSPENAGYLYCTSDSSSWSQGQQASCNDGFRDSSSGDLTVAGGTSFAAPIFAGMLAIISQKENSTGQGLINSILYSLAGNSGTYNSAFHDITSGGNQCTAGLNYCSSAGESHYYAGTGYDEASGLGSVDLNNLMGSWTKGGSASLDATATALSPATSTPNAGSSDTITVTVSPQSSSIATTPTGTLTIAIDGTVETSTLALTNGSATYTFSSTASGAHVITAKYSGDSTFAPSIGTVTVDVSGSGGSSTSGSFALSATNVSVSQGSTGTSTVTVKSQDSYAGTVGFTLSTSSSSLQEYGCYASIPNATVSANGTASTSVTIYTSKSDCTSASWVKGAMRFRFTETGTRTLASTQIGSPARGVIPIGLASTLAGLLLFRSRKRRTKTVGVIIYLGLACLLSITTSCGSSSKSNDVPKGSYTLTLYGADTANSTIASSTSFALTVK